MDESDWIAWCDELIHGRHHTGPRHLGPPGPDADELRAMLAAAAAAPDHRRLRPWRFIVFSPQSRAQLAQAFEAALLERDASAGEAERADARLKAHRGEVLLLAIVDQRAEAPDVRAVERVISLGCAIQNLLLAARARGYESGLLSGRALTSAAFRAAFDIVEGEDAVCFISLGTPRTSRGAHPRPAVDDFVRWI